jgi:CBS domain containing-hemolysin-like protein
MLLVIWMLGMQGTMGLCMMLCSMLVMIMSMKSMAMCHFMMMSRFMMVTWFMGFMGLFMMVGGRLVMLSSVVVVVMFGHIFPYQLTKQNAQLIHIAPLHYKNN